MQSTSLMDMLTTPTIFPSNIDWEGKMEPSSPADNSQHGFAEEIVYDDTYDYCNEGLFNNGLIDLEDLKPDPSILLKGDVLVIPLGKLPEDLCYDDKLKIPSSESVLLGSYAPLPTVVEDEFYDFPMQPEAKAAQSGGPETLMEFDCVSGSMELMNHLTPPQTPPQTTSFGGVVGCVLPMQPSLHAVPVPPQQQQEQFQPLYAPQPNVQSLLQQQQQVSFQGANVTTTTDYYIMDEYSTMAPQQTGAGGNMQQQQQQQIAVTMEPLQQVPDDIATTSFNFDLNYTPQQLSEMAKIMRSLQLPLELEEKDSPYHDDESCGFSEVGSIGDDSRSAGSSASSMVAHSPVYSDSAESSAYYGSRGNDGDDEDWSPSKTKKLNARNGGAVVKKRPNGSGGGGRGIEEKKSRKKEQNKNAATRYRQKKKAEIEEILIEEEKLRERNEELKHRSQDLGREISCIKKLMREFCRNKGLL